MEHFARHHRGSIQPAQQIREQVEHTLSVLGRDQLEGVNMRRMDHGRYRAEGVQNAYNLLSRGDEDVLQICREHGLAYVPYFPLGSHSPVFPHVTEDSVVQEAAQRLEATPSQMGLVWLLQHSPNILLMPDTGSVAHLEENMAAADLVLPPDVVQALDAAGDLELRLGT